MASKKKPADHAKAACRAHTDLNIFYGIIALLEGGLIHQESYGAADRIIAICKSESQKCLVRYDRSIAAIPSHDARPASGSAPSIHEERK